MEYKTKTIIWEDNNEPPKNYIWAKKDGKFYEYSYVTKSWIESKLIKAEESGGSDGDGGGDSVDINTILDNISIKDDLLTKLQAIDYSNQDPSDGILTDLTFDDVFNDYNDFIKSWFYGEETPAIASIIVPPIIDKYDYGLNLRIPDGLYISYSIFIVNGNDNINIYALKVVKTPPV